MKRKISLLLATAVFVTFSAFATMLEKVGVETVTFYNFSNQDYDLGGHQVTVNNEVYNIDDLTVQKTLVVPPGGSVELGLLIIPTGAGSIGLWLPGTFPTANPQSSQMVDFMQYGDGGMPHEALAVAAGRWVSGEFVSGSAPFQRTTQNYNDIGSSFWEEEPQTSVPVLPGNNVISVYPNPFNDEFLVETDFSTGTVYDLSLTDSKGMDVVNIKAIRESSIKVDCRDFPKGMYYLTVTSQKGDIIILPVIKR